MAKDDNTRDLREDDPARERIARRAYERFEARGREDGHDQDDWLEAEREVQKGTGE